MKRSIHLPLLTLVTVTSFCSLMVMMKTMYRGTRPWYNADGQETSKRHGQTIQIMMIAYGGPNKLSIYKTLQECIESMVNRTSSTVNLHLVTDDYGRQVLADLKRLSQKLTVQIYSKTEIRYRTGQMLSVNFMNHFRKTKGGYYWDECFFTSIVVDQLLPDVKKLIILDADLSFRSDIAQLNAYFDMFNDSQIFGLAFEQQPVYNNAFSAYNAVNANSTLGMAPPRGFPGFNSGVTMVDLEKMRQSDLYKSLLHENSAAALVKKYKFQGHLGDQDFYTLIAVDYGQLFYRLPCVWNKQLCQWWSRAFDKKTMQKYACNESVRVYHGNCGTPIPNE